MYTALPAGPAEMNGALRQRDTHATIFLARCSSLLLVTHGSSTNFYFFTILNSVYRLFFFSGQLPHLIWSPGCFAITLQNWIFLGYMLPRTLFAMDLVLSYIIHKYQRLACHISHHRLSICIGSWTTHAQNPFGSSFFVIDVISQILPDRQSHIWKSDIFSWFNFRSEITLSWFLRVFPSLYPRAIY